MKSSKLSRIAAAALNRRRVAGERHPYQAVSLNPPIQATARTILAKCIYIALAFSLKKHKHPA
jgi:hypothetical protein